MYEPGGRFSIGRIERGEEPSMTTAYARQKYRGASLDSVRVEETMHRGIVGCRPEASLFAVARLMAAHRIHAVVVADGSAESSWGIVSDLDLAGAASAGALHERTAGETATTPGVVVSPDETLARAAQLMREYDTHHLIVLGRGSRRPMGVISTLDVADVVAELES
jgi:CBS domain-containing protein